MTNPADESSRSRIHVLLVEDDDVDARAIQKMLAEDAEFRPRVTHVDCLTAAIGNLQSHADVDVVLLDLGLPESKGLPTLDKFREQVADVAVVVCTSADDEQVGLRAVQQGAQDYLVKGKVDADLMKRTLAYAIERHRMQLGMRQLMAELERSNEDLVRFAYVASHDLKAPLRTVVGFCQLLEQRCRGQSEETDHFLDHILEGGERMSRIIDDLLEYSRVKKAEKAPEPVDFQDVVGEVLENLTAAIDETAASVTCEGLPTLASNRSQMLQLFQNLIGNGIKFHSDQAPQVRVTAEPQEQSWLFSVRDNGIGIDRKNWDQVFTVFTRLHGEAEYSGTGIGLAICQKIVELQGGRIWVDSEPGEGTTFHFTIPIDESGLAE
jgi:signal transduction histidine kinase